MERLSYSLIYKCINKVYTRGVENDRARARWPKSTKSLIILSRALHARLNYIYYSPNHMYSYLGIYMLCIVACRAITKQIVVALCSVICVQRREHTSIVPRANPIVDMSLRAHESGDKSAPISIEKIGYIWQWWFFLQLLSLIGCFLNKFCKELYFEHALLKPMFSVLVWNLN